MNKQAIITILLAIVAMTGQAQEIKKVAATPEDIIMIFTVFKNHQLHL